MGQLLPERTTSNTRAEHVADHNTLHALFDESVASPNNGDTMRFDAGTGLWTPVGWTTIPVSADESDWDNGDGTWLFNGDGTVTGQPTAQFEDKSMSQVLSAESFGYVFATDITVVGTIFDDGTDSGWGSLWWLSVGLLYAPPDGFTLSTGVSASTFDGGGSQAYHEVLGQGPSIDPAPTGQHTYRTVTHESLLTGYIDDVLVARQYLPTLQYQTGDDIATPTLFLRNRRNFDVSGSIVDLNSIVLKVATLPPELV